MTEQQDRVNQMIERIERHQKALKLSDVRFVARYQRFLGSPKTWCDRLCARAWDAFGSSLGKWEQKLAAFVAELDGTSDLTEFFEALPIAMYGQALYDKLQGQKSDRRVGWLIAPTGVGKSWTMLRLARQNPTDSAYLHINRGAKESLMVLARQMARATGAMETSGGASTYMNVVEQLKGNPLTLLIDDVHEGGILMLKLLKHLIDDTRCKLILGTYPTAWKMLLNGSTDAHSEAQQLIGRSIKPVERRWEKGVTREDVTAYLKVAIGGNGECGVLSEKIAPTLRKHGNLRALADAIELARMNVDDVGEEMDTDWIEEAVASVCPADTKK